MRILRLNNPTRSSSYPHKNQNSTIPPAAFFYRHKLHVKFQIRPTFLYDFTVSTVLRLNGRLRVRY